MRKIMYNLALFILHKNVKPSRFRGGGGGGGGGGGPDGAMLQRRPTNLENSRARA